MMGLMLMLWSQHRSHLAAPVSSHLTGADLTISDDWSANKSRLTIFLNKNGNTAHVAFRLSVCLCLPFVTW